MTDREMLELAAKAAGLPLCAEWDTAADGIMIGHGDGDLQVWNPLDDDGDALRLAVRLELRVHVTDCFASASRPDDEHYTRYDFAADCDPYAATRRAIVRAAAKIGRAT